MEYKIGEVSKILNISKEMIRYYEKQGILKPSRKEDNNYRTYSVMDVFLLMEIIRYQSIHFGIKDISELLNEHYLENYAQHLYQYYQEIDQDIIKKILLKERVKELAERIETCKFNLGKYWVKNVPANQLMEKVMTMINYKYLLKIGIYFFPRKEWFMWNLWSYLKKRKKLGGMEWKRDT